MKRLLLLLAFPALSYAQTDTVKTKDPANGAKPDMNKISYDDVKWTKADGGGFWFYYKPTKYLFPSNEFQTITMENGDVLVYIFASDIYLLLPNFGKTLVNTEHDVELGSAESSVFIRKSRGSGFYIFDKGLYVDNLEDLGLNSLRHVYVLRSRRTDKRYYIKEADFLFGALSKAIGIASE